MAFTWNGKKKSTLQMNTDKTFTFVRKKSQNKKTDQGGAVGAGVGRGQGDQGRDQDPGFHRWEEGWTAVKT